MKSANDNKIKILFIGTGSALKNLFRFHTSFFITSFESNILVDCGDGISRKLKELNFNHSIIENILISHLHPDHFSGLASLIVQMKLQKRVEPLNIFIHKDLELFLKNFFEQIYLFESRLLFKLNIIPYENEQTISISNDFNFITKQNSHLDKFKALKGRNKIYFISPSFLFYINDKKIFYSSDVGNKSDLYLFDSEFDISIIETTHIEIDDINNFIQRSFAKRYFMVHIDENKEYILKKTFNNEALNEKVFIPNDGDEYLI